MSKKLFVGNLSGDCDTFELKSLFERYGKVTECDVLADFGFVHYEKSEDAGRAAESLNGYELKGKVIRVEVSKNQFKSGRLRPTGPIPRYAGRPPRTDRPYPDERFRDDPYSGGPYRPPYRDPYRDPYPSGSPRLRPAPPPVYSSSRYYDDRSPRWDDYDRRDSYYSERRPPSYYRRYSPPPRDYPGYDPPPGYRARSRSPPYRRPEPPPSSAYSSYYDDDRPYRDPPPRSPYGPPSSAGLLRRRTPPRPLRPPPSVYEGYRGGSSYP